MILMQKREKIVEGVKFTDYAVPDVVGFILEKLGEYLLVAVYGDNARQYLLKSSVETPEDSEPEPEKKEKTPKIAPPNIKIALDDFNVE